MCVAASGRCVLTACSLLAHCASKIGLHLCAALRRNLSPDFWLVPLDSAHRAYSAPLQCPSETVCSAELDPQRRPRNKAHSNGIIYHLWPLSAPLGPVAPVSSKPMLWEGELDVSSAPLARFGSRFQSGIVRPGWPAAPPTCSAGLWPHWSSPAATESQWSGARLAAGRQRAGRPVAPQKGPMIHHGALLLRLRGGGAPELAGT